MQKKLVVLTLIYYWVEATPLNRDTFDFNADISDLKYDSKDLEQYLKSLENGQNNKRTKKKTNKGAEVNFNIEDLKKFFKSLGLKDEGSYDDSEKYGVSESAAAKAVGIKGKENRTYKKGTKTTGFHRVQHKDEYKKDKEFNEEEVISGSIDKVGIKGFGYDVEKGSAFDKGRFNHLRKKGLFGKEGFFDKGKAQKDFSGYNNESDDYFNSDNNY